MRFPLIIFACALVFLAGPAAATEPLPLRSGDPVTILRTDGTKQKATFRGFEKNPPRLLLADPQARDRGGWRHEIPISEVTAVEARGGPVFHERRILVGTLAGMAAGSVFGMLLGVLAAPSHGPDRRWTFDDAAADTTRR